MTEDHLPVSGILANHVRHSTVEEQSEEDPSASGEPGSLGSKST
jgi:hypothetical protein